MIHGLVEDWQFPFFADFDEPITKQLLNQVIITTEGCENTLLAFTSDQGGVNEGLQKSLEITKDNQSYQNPAHPNNPDEADPVDDPDPAKQFFLYHPLIEKGLDSRVCVPLANTVKNDDFVNILLQIFTKSVLMM